MSRARTATLAGIVAVAAFVSIADLARAAATAGAAQRRTTKTHVTPQGRTWDSIKRLPDWSGTWDITEASVHEASLAAVGQDGGRIPLTPRFAALRDANVGPGGPRVDNETKCMNEGLPASTSLPIGHEYLFTPGRVTVIFESGLVRRIDTSGRKHPPASELTDTFAGNSIGHWEGQTLVVDTIGLTAKAELLVGFRGVTEQTHLRERIFLKDRNTLQIDTVVTDRQVFTRPYAYTRLYARSATPLFEYFPCTDDNRDVMVNGRQTDVNLTPPPARQP